eukprot:TRINITY_DN4768_c0_g1_i12.p1 TRINITY_DN4768_c0_g1~~TRINITY_DN4768_c0_g1_i12.p1  ORF type:complete len:2487 (+),score=282.84 TRINITY_DN4768_c0_g1_i12:63-7523(+)
MGGIYLDASCLLLRSLVFVSIFINIAANTKSKSNVSIDGVHIIGNYNPSYLYGKIFVWNSTLHVLPDRSSSYLTDVNGYFTFLHVQTGDFKWVLKNLQGTYPRLRNGYCFTQSGDEIYLFGGHLSDVYFAGELDEIGAKVLADDVVYVLNMMTGAWSTIDRNGQPPSAAYHCKIFYAKQKLYTYGGIGNFGFRHTDLHSYDFQSKLWAKITPNGQQPTFNFEHGVIYNDKYHIISPCVAAECNAFLYILDLESNFWSWAAIEAKTGGEKAIKITNGISAVSQSRMYIYGRQQPPSLKDFSQSILLVLDLGKTLDRMVETVQYFDQPKSSSNFYTVPTPKWYGSAVVRGHDFILYGTWSGLCSDTSLWYLSIDSYVWRLDINSQGPYSRDGPAHAVSEDSFYLFGGKICLGSLIVTNELWVFHLESQDWKLLSSHTDPSISNESTAPFLKQALIGYWNQTIYAMGGTAYDFTMPVIYRYSLRERKWTQQSQGEWRIDQYLVLLPTSYLQNKQEIWVPSVGTRVNSTFTPSDNFFVYDMETNQGRYAYVGSDTPALNRGAHVFVDNKYCALWSTKELYEPRFSCYREDLYRWETVNLKSSCVISIRSQAVSQEFVYIIGGEEPSRFGSINRFDIGSKECVSIELKNLGINSFVRSGHFILKNKWYLFGGYRSYMGASISLPYFFAINLAYCTSSASIYFPTTKEFTDGSGSYNMIPGTSCSWRIQGARFLKFSSIAAENSLLRVGVPGCDHSILDSEGSKNWVKVNSSYVGFVFESSSKIFDVELIVPSSYYHESGFEALLNDCRNGFVWRDSCVCPEDSFVNFLGECVTCQTSQDGCAVHYKAQEVQYRLPLPQLLSGSFKLDNRTYLLGGLQNSDTRFPIYHPLNRIYSTERQGLWSESVASGTIPAGRYGFCIAGDESFLFIAGGILENDTDNYIYRLDTSIMRWERLAKHVGLTAGPSCTLHNMALYVYGGSRDGQMLSSLSIYHEDGSTNFLDNFGPAIGFGISAHLGSEWYLLSSDLESESATRLYILSFDALKWKVLEINTSPFCCSFSPQACTISRQMSSYALVDSSLYIFGGIYRGQLQSDVVVLDLTKGFVKDWWRKESIAIGDASNTIPGHYGGYVVDYGDLLELTTGIEDLKPCIGVDSRIWDITSRNWISGPNQNRPISRSDVIILPFTDSSVLVYGGKVCTTSNRTLEDVWIYTHESNIWVKSIDGISSVATQLFENSFKIFASNAKIFVFGFASNNYLPLLWEVKNHAIQTIRISLQVGDKISSMPRRRYAICMIEDAIFIWGGQALFTTTSANAFYLLNLTSFEVHYKEGSNSPDITYDALCAAGNGIIYILGGTTLNGSRSKMIQLLDYKTLQWTKVSFIESLDSNIQSIHYVNDGVLATVKSIDMTGKQTLRPWFFNSKILSWTPLKESLLLEGNPSLVSLGKEAYFLAMFPAQRGFTSFTIEAYRPVLCDSRNPTRVAISNKVSSFNDGSSGTGYFSGESCAWEMQAPFTFLLEYRLSSNDIMSLEGDCIDTAGPSMISGTGIFGPFFCGNGSLLLSLQTTGSRFVQQPGKGFEVRLTRCFMDDGVQALANCACATGSYIDMNTLNCIPCPPDKPGDQSSLEQGGLITQVVVPILSSIAAFVFLTILGRRKLRKRSKALLYRKMNVQISHTEILIGEYIGGGAFGEVFKGVWRGTEVAVKRLYDQGLEKDVLLQFRDEVGTMTELKHPNIVLYMGACFEPSNLAIICELMKEGTLFDYLRSNPQIPMSQKLGFMRDIVKGMQYLHSANPPIIHGDLKSPNLLMNEKRVIKISDFGLSSTKQRQTREVAGSLPWMAPEIISGGHISTMSDVYSCGIIMWEIITQQVPYESLAGGFSIALRVVQAKLRPTIPDETPQQLRAIIESLWEHDSSNRINFDTLSSRIDTIANDKFIGFLGVLEQVRDNDQSEDTSGAIVTLSAQDVGLLWNAEPEAMESAVIRFNEFIRRMVDKHDGKSVFVESDEHIIIFANWKSAVDFCIEAQEMALLVDWPEEIVRILDQHESKGLFRGFAVKMGCCRARIRKADYYADHFQQLERQAYQKSSYLCFVAVGGQLLVEQSVYELIIADETIQTRLHLHEHSYQSQGQVTLEENIYEVYPTSLCDRVTFIRQNQIAANVCYPIKDQDEDDPSHVLPNRVPSENESSHSKDKSGRHDMEHNNPKEKQGNRLDRARISPRNNLRLQFELDFQDLMTTETRLGVGSFGSVLLGSYKGKPVAVKKMFQQTTQEKYYLAFLSEVSLMQRLNHPNIVRLIGACTRVPNLSIVMEYVELGNLSQLLHSKKEKLTNTNRRRIVEGIIRGMAHLHSFKPPILHRDLKTSNVLIDAAYNPKICDFGFSRIKAANQMMTRCGTVAYEAPEILDGRMYTEKVDVYSFGIMVWEIITRESLYPNMDSMQIANYVLAGRRPKIPQKADNVLLNLMVRCWNQDADSRPKFQEIADLREFELRLVRPSV